MLAALTHPGDRRSLGAVLVGAFLLRLLPLLLGALLAEDPFCGPDTVTYDGPARRLAAGEGLTDELGRPAVGRPPGYSTFLAAVYLLAGGPSWAAVRVVQAALGAAAAWAIHAALVSRGAGAGVALLGAGLAALDPVAVGQSPFILREQLLLTLVTLLLAALLGRWRGRHLLAAVLLVALALTHQLYALLGPFLALGDLLAARTWRARRVRLLRWAAIGLLVVSGVWLWARRNERLTGRLALTLADNPVPARELWLTATCTNRWLSGDFATGFQALAWREEARLVSRLGVEGAKAEMYRRTLELWREQPLTCLGRLLRQNAWYWLELPGAVNLVEHPRLFLVRWAVLPWHWVRLTCAGAGVLWLLGGGRWRPWSPALATLGFFALAPAPLYPVPRYLGPAVPLLCLLAALGLAESLRRREEGRP